MGIEVVVADLDRRACPTASCRGVLVQYPGASGRRPRPARRSIDGGPRARRAGRRRRRPAGADAAGVARARSAPTSWSAPRSASACRCSTAARTPASWRCAPGLERHLPGRLVGVSRRRRGPPGVPARAADPRAAHPPRQGDLQHLHRAGAAGRRRLDVRRLPRPRGAAGDRDAAPTATPRCWPPALRDGGVEVVHERVLRHRDRRGCPAGPPRVVAAARERGRAPAARRRRPRRHLHLRDHRRGRRSPAVLEAFGVDRATSTTSTRAPATRCPPSCARDDAVPRPTRSSTPTAPRPQMLRYLRRLSARDYALDRGMIPLGSCTMKLNATTEMEPVTLPGFADLHPFAPAEDAAGLPRADRRARGLAGRGDRLRPGLDPAERRLAGRARRAARDPRLPPRQRRRAAATSA